MVGTKDTDIDRRFTALSMKKKPKETSRVHDGSNDDNPRGGIRDNDLKRLANEAAEGAVQKAKTGLDKELASIKEELRLTGVRPSTRMPPRHSARK
jgi:hypothetical protein